MIKLIGAILITGGMASAGIAAVHKLSARIDLIARLLSALEIMQSEICFRLTPIPEVAEIISKGSRGEVKAMFDIVAEGAKNLGSHSLNTIWGKAVSETCKLLNPEEMYVVVGLGNSLGRYDSENQVSAIEYVRRRLERCLTDAEAEKKRQGRMYGALGLLCGLAVAIIFV